MTEPETSRKGGQFSLRTLCLAIGGGAVLFGAWRALEGGIFLTGAFLVSWLVPLGWRRAIWRRSYLLAWTVLYLPFVALASYALVWVPCDHCKTTVWTVLPYGPGLMPVGAARELWKLPRLGDAVGFPLAFCVSLAMLVALTWLLRLRWWWFRIAMVVVAGGYSSFAAVVVLAMIRM